MKLEALSYTWRFKKWTKYLKLHEWHYVKWNRLTMNRAPELSMRSLITMTDIGFLATTFCQKIHLMKFHKLYLNLMRSRIWKALSWRESISNIFGQANCMTPQLSKFPNNWQICSSLMAPYSVFLKGDPITAKTGFAMLQYPKGRFGIAHGDIW